MSVPGVAGLLLVAVLLLPSVNGANGDASDACVRTFHEFEKAVIRNPDNVDALARAFFIVNEPAPLSVRVVFHGNSSNGTDTVISANRNCPPGREIWLWVPSPILIFVEPTKLNMWALNTLNFLHDWSPSRADIYVPSVCNLNNSSAKQFNLFDELTMRVQTYAAKSIFGENAYLGNVLHGCGDDIMTTLLNTTMPNNKHDMQVMSGISINMYLTGNSFLVMLVILVCASVLHLNRSTIQDMASDTDDRPLYGIYGFFWGCAVLSVGSTIFLLERTIRIIKVNLESDAQELQNVGQVVLFQLILGAIASLLVAIPFGLKLDFSTPSILIWLFRLFTCNLCCCCNDHAKMAAKKIVQIISLWSLVLFMVLCFCHLSLVFLALLARPSTVISSIVIYIFIAAYAVHSLAIMFAFTKRKLRVSMGEKAKAMNLLHTTVVFFMFTALILVSFSFGYLITAANAIAFYGSTRNSLYAILSTFITPLLVTVVSWAIYKLGSLCLIQLHAPKEEEITEENDELSNLALHIHVDSEQLRLLQQPEAQMEEGMAGSAPGGQDYQQI